MTGPSAPGGTSGTGRTPGPATARPDAARLRRLELTVRRRVDSIVHGDHPGLALGSGSDPEELVRYQPGHDVRRIDWNVTARTGDPYVWLTRAEHAVETRVLIDRTASMAFGTGESEKSEVAEWIAGALTLLVRGAGDRVGITLFDRDGVRALPPSSPRTAARRLLTASPAPRDGASALTLGEAIRRMTAQAPRRGVRVIVSDLVDPSGAVEAPFEWQLPLKRLAARHDTVVIEVIDPRELELPDVGELTLVDPESGAQRDVSTRDPRLRLAFAEAAARHRDATAGAVRASGAAHLAVRTDDDLPRELRRFLDRRRREPARLRRVR